MASWRASVIIASSSPATMLMPLTLGAMALGALGVAARGLATNRPFLFSPRWFLAGVTAVFWANFGLALRHALRAPLPSGQIDVAVLVVPGLLAIVTLL